ncbi:hypothetical protein CDV31_002184 [Fusarium ambrosium]|uniref:Mitochondrial thiamine pyrophosphate carrier 1 n=1 Tax=Fusarium ambrosium TaxID=131363 RepID=A0A428UXM3_9HYPO|nr:hypothetical protein CDV31_002184 [Fusarium ambrosium]
MSSDTAKNIVAGTMGGVAQVMIGQPFDIVKVRLQASGGNALTVTRNIWRREGPLAFYKGTIPPLLGVGACASIQFGAFHFFRELLEERNRNLQRNTDGTLSLGQFYLAGGAAGLSNSVLSGPIEHVRIRLQTQPHGSNRLYAGPTDCVRKIWKHSGIRGSYRGQVVTILREFHGFGIWFASYEGLVQKVMKQDQTPRSEIPSWKFALCGGIAGELIWLLTYPFDVIKSKMQTDGFGVERRYKNMREAFRVTLEVGGVAGLFKGIGPTLLRAMPVSAGTFAV